MTIVVKINEITVVEIEKVSKRGAFVWDLYILKVLPLRCSKPVLVKYRKLVPVRPWPKTLFWRWLYLIKSTFWIDNQNILLNNFYFQGIIWIIDFQYQLNLSTLIFQENQIFRLSSHEKSKCSDWADIDKSVI